jgi:hypothetical protein
MLSHACASCGKLLDDSSRSHSRDLRMWVATCTRCGFAVRWAPREAREPARVWARLRALNLRLGVSVGCLQLASASMLFAVIFLDDRLRRVFVATDLESLLDLLGPSIVAAVVGGLFVGMCAAMLAPFRRVHVTLIAAWTFTAAVVGLISTVLLLGEFGAERFWSACAEVFRRHERHSNATAIVLGAAFLVSIVAAAWLGFSVRMTVRNAVRRASRARRETFAPVRTAARPPFGAVP